MSTTTQQQYYQQPLSEDIFVERYRQSVEHLVACRERAAALKAALTHARDDEKRAQAALEKLLMGRETPEQMSFTVEEEVATGPADQDGPPDSDVELGYLIASGSGDE